MFKQKITILYAILNIIKVIYSQQNIDEIVCSQCNHKITNSMFLIDQVTDQAVKSNQQYRFKKNILIHSFKNPQGLKFQVITSKKATLICDPVEYEEHSFFEGFTWRICSCPICGSHHGWLFSPLDKYCENIKSLNKTICKARQKFYGLITTRIKDSQLEGEKIDL